MTKKKSISVSLDENTIATLNTLKKNSTIRSRSELLQMAINRELRKYQLEIIGNGQKTLDFIPKNNKKGE